MEDIVCNGCALLCDDTAAEIDDGQVRSLGLCLLGFTHLNVALKHQRSDSVDDLLEKAAELLTSAENPLVFGWSNASNEAIKEGLALTEILGGHFDSTANFAPILAVARIPDSSLTI